MAYEVERVKRKFLHMIEHITKKSERELEANDFTSEEGKELEKNIKSVLKKIKNMKELEAIEAIEDPEEKERRRHFKEMEERMKKIGLEQEEFFKKLNSARGDA